MPATAILKTRVTPEWKTRVSDLSQSDLVTEAVWLRRLIGREIQRLSSGASARPDELRPTANMPRAHDTHQGRVSRLYVRLRREDRLLLRERAAARGMASATYVSALVRAHLRHLAPLPKEELAALKRAVAELGAIGRNLNQIARAANQGERPEGLNRENVKAFLTVCTALRDHTKDIIKTNLSSWEAGYAEEAH